MAKHLSDRFQQKLKDRENYNETVVKTTLKTYLHTQKIIDAIKERVKYFSQRYHMASLILSGFLKSLDSHDNIEYIFEQTFIRQLMLGFEGTSKKYHRLIHFIRENPRYKLNLTRHRDDSNIYGFGSQIYLTNLKNSLSMYIYI